MEYSVVLLLIFIVQSQFFGSKLRLFIHKWNYNRSTAPKNQSINSLHSLKAHIEPLNRVSEGTYRNVVHTAEGIIAQCIKSDTAR